MFSSFSFFIPPNSVRSEGGVVFFVREVRAASKAAFWWFVAEVTPVLFPNTEVKLS